MDPSLLQILWFLLFGVLITGYAVLDGFDLGVGVLSLLRRDPDERRLMINAIGPVWDGNEVWLVTGGGALFAAFPLVYATVFSSLYLAVVLLLLALIARAVSMEFRGKVASTTWRDVWDWAFGLGSLLITLLFGVALGNIMQGIPLDAEGRFGGTFLGLLNPYAILVGLLAIVMFTCHGALYMAQKCDGELQSAMKTWASRAWVGWAALYVVAAVATIFAAPAMLADLPGNVLGWLALLALLVALVYLPVALRADQLRRAFLASSVAVVAMLGQVGFGLYPKLVPSSVDPAFSLTIANASSSPRTLMTMLVIALIGMPLVVGYTVFIYRVFKGKVELTEHSY